MRIAVCFSGQVRTGLQTADSFLSYLGALLPSVDFFVHTWDNESISFQDETVPPERKGEQNALDFSKLGRLVEIYKPKALEISSLGDVLTRENSKGYFEPFNPMFYSIWRSNELKRTSENEWSMKYDYVVRTRFDLGFEKGLTLEKDLEHHSGVSIIDPMNVINHAFEDQFWIASSHDMDELARFYFVRAKTRNGHLSWQIQQKQFVDGLGLPITIIPGKIWIQR